jgi:VanZ family protein
MLLRIVRWLPALVWMAVIFYWSSQPVLPIDDRPDAEILHVQAHVVAYGILALLLALAIGTGRRHLAMVLLLVTLYGMSDEFHQSFVPGRKGQVQEVLVDAASAAVALAAFAGLQSAVLSSRQRGGAASSVSESRGWRG